MLLNDTENLESQGYIPYGKVITNKDGII